MCTPSDSAYVGRTKDQRDVGGGKGDALRTLQCPRYLRRLMERALADIPWSRGFVYLDELLTHAADFECAVANLRDVLHAIRRAGLHLHPRICQLLRRETSFLGHVVRSLGVSTDPAKVAAVRDWPVPHKFGELQSFLGLASYYRQFVKDFATQKGQLFQWGEDFACAFTQLQSAALHCGHGVSNVAIGALLYAPPVHGGARCCDPGGGRSTGRPTECDHQVTAMVGSRHRLRLTTVVWRTLT